ncbi:chaperonin 10-like protein [Paraphoma chrysanthemicola]|nr:chaperonin 10-like protein [Paraphoma chrysanthemicola]
MSLPSTMHAIKVGAPGSPAIKQVPLPRLRDDYILVKVNAVALNPTDWKHTTIPIMATHSENCTVGADYAGTVVAVGSKVTKPWQVGDRIAGFTHGCNHEEPEDGAFAEYAMVKGDAGQVRIPEGMSDEDAATLGVAVVTCGQALYQKLRLPLPGEGSLNGKWFLVYGGSSGMGSMAIQYAKLSGCKVIAVCSPRNFELVKSRGAIEAFDYKDPECAKKIREYTNDELDLSLDCIAEGASIDICAESISSKGGKICYLLFTPPQKRKDVEALHTLGYTMTGERFTFAGGAMEFPASKEDFEQAKMFCEVSSRLLAEGKLIPHPAKVGPDGLKGVLGGMVYMREGKVSGEKLVYRVAETPKSVL